MSGNMDPAYAIQELERRGLGDHPKVVAAKRRLAAQRAPGGDWRDEIIMQARNIAAANGGKHAPVHQGLVYDTPVFDPNHDDAEYRQRVGEIVEQSRQEDSPQGSLSRGAADKYAEGFTFNLSSQADELVEPFIYHEDGPLAALLDPEARAEAWRESQARSDARRILQGQEWSDDFWGTLGANLAGGIASGVGISKGASALAKALAGSSAPGARTAANAARVMSAEPLRPYSWKAGDIARNAAQNTAQGAVYGAAYAAGGGYDPREGVSTGAMLGHPGFVAFRRGGQALGNAGQMIGRQFKSAENAALERTAEIMRRGGANPEILHATPPAADGGAMPPGGPRAPSGDGQGGPAYDQTAARLASQGLDELTPEQLRAGGELGMKLGDMTERTQRGMAAAMRRAGPEGDPYRRELIERGRTRAGRVYDAAADQIGPHGNRELLGRNQTMLERNPRSRDFQPREEPLRYRDAPEQLLAYQDDLLEGQRIARERGYNELPGSRLPEEEIAGGTFGRPDIVSSHQAAEEVSRLADEMGLLHAALAMERASGVRYLRTAEGHIITAIPESRAVRNQNVDPIRNMSDEQIANALFERGIARADMSRGKRLAALVKARKAERGLPEAEGADLFRNAGRIQMIKRAADKKAQAAKGPAGDPDGSGRNAQMVADMARSVLERFRDASGNRPGLIGNRYHAAFERALSVSENAAGETVLRGAYARGRKMFSESTSPVDALRDIRKIKKRLADASSNTKDFKDRSTRANVAQAAEEELHSFRLGAMEGYLSVVQGQKADAGRMLTPTSPKVRAKLKVLFENDAQREAYERFLTGERLKATTEHGIFGGSPTAPRLIDDAEFQADVTAAYAGQTIDPDAAIGAFGHLLRGEPLAAAGKLTRAGFDKWRELRDIGFSRKVAAEMVKQFSREDLDAIAAQMEMARAKGERFRLRPELASKLSEEAKEELNARSFRPDDGAETFEARSRKPTPESDPQGARQLESLKRAYEKAEQSGKRGAMTAIVRRTMEKLGVSDRTARRWLTDMQEVRGGLPSPRDETRPAPRNPDPMDAPENYIDPDAGPNVVPFRDSGVSQDIRQLPDWPLRRERPIDDFFVASDFDHLSPARQARVLDEIAEIERRRPVNAAYAEGEKRKALFEALKEQRADDLRTHRRKRAVGEPQPFRPAHSESDLSLERRLALRNAEDEDQILLHSDRKFSDSLAGDPALERRSLSEAGYRSRSRMTDKQRQEADFLRRQREDDLANRRLEPDEMGESIRQRLGGVTEEGEARLADRGDVRRHDIDLSFEQYDPLTDDLQVLFNPLRGRRPADLDRELTEAHAHILDLTGAIPETFKKVLYQRAAKWAETPAGRAAMAPYRQDPGLTQRRLEGEQFARWIAAGEHLKMSPGLRQRLQNAIAEFLERSFGERGAANRFLKEKLVSPERQAQRISRGDYDERVGPSRTWRNRQTRQDAGQRGPMPLRSRDPASDPPLLELPSLGP